MAGSQNDASEEFTSFYLQQATKEFAEDLDKVRNADDFKGDAFPMLIRALQQGTALFSSADQRRIMDAAQKQPEEGSHEDTSSSGSSISDEGK
ncbi:hypothetical protein TruAng_010074 [Truncatella angustata]|nr:hypothetical protein TruAng_010074 [Truncatella angustata]